MVKQFIYFFKKILDFFCILLYTKASYYFYIIGGVNMNLNRKPIIGIVSKRYG